uniref:Uncharacterized protein n=1 Tax=Arundo donax TaxID=35708 RepID=A0A0A9GAC9_ARUDO
MKVVVLVINILIDPPNLRINPGNTNQPIIKISVRPYIKHLPWRSCSSTECKKVTRPISREHGHHHTQAIGR